MLPACRDLIDAGVACLAIGSRERRSEYVSAFTDVWATAIRESQLPAEPELERLERVFLPWGAAKKDLYETAEAPEKIPGETEAVCAEQRRNYTSGEARRVGVSFAVAAKDAHSSVILGAQDTDKTIAAIEGPVPDDAGDVELTEDGLREAMYRRNAVPLHRGARAVSRGRKAPGIRHRTGRGPPPSFV